MVRWLLGWLLAFLVMMDIGWGTAHATCVGRFPNPVTDICWKCVFPIKIAGAPVVQGNPDTPSPTQPLCVCPRPPLGPMPGIPVSFWEPVRMVDVVRTPYCLVNMGGMTVGSTGIRSRGDVGVSISKGTQHSFYHVHWYVYPIMYIFQLVLDFACMEEGDLDLAYLTELDPLWNDDEKSAILNPEGAVFGNMVAQSACIADCGAASASLPMDELFWCAGCQGGMYPFSGTTSEHTGGVQASLLIMSRFMAKMHRELLLKGYVGSQGMCKSYPMPLIKKSQYRTQMLYPLPQTQACQTLGHTEVLWQSGREFPYKGSDFGYMIWRKRDCCLGAGV